MVALVRSSILAIKKESVAGVVEALTTSVDFVALREGFAMQSENEVIDTDTLQNGIGASKSIVVGENPSATFPGYFKHSGVEGQAPEFSEIIESCMGSVVENSTEYSTIAGSSVSVVALSTDVGANFSQGQALLIKDGANGYSIRNIDSISGDNLTLNFEVDSAPAASVALGKAVFYNPEDTDHPTYTLHRWQASSGAHFYDVVAGARTVNLSLTMPARDLVTLDAEIEGISYYFKPITISASNTAIDFTDSSSTVEASLSEGIYKTPLDLADEISTKMTAASVDEITCVYSSTTGKYTISSDGTALSMLWNSGTNNATSVGSTLGFTVTADDTGALTYTSDSAIAFTPPYTPAYDTSDPNQAISNEFIIGGTTDNFCRPASNVAVQISTPKTQVLSICAENGVDSTLVLSREVKISGKVILPQYEAEIFDRAFNNTTTKFMYNGGVKDGSGNWTAGKCFNIYMQSGSITAIPLNNENGYVIYALEAKGFITGTTKDIYINFI